MQGLGVKEKEKHPKQRPEAMYCGGWWGERYGFLPKEQVNYMTSKVSNSKILELLDFGILIFWGFIV